MLWGEVELEAEVRDWFVALDETSQARVRFHVDRLAEFGPGLDEPYTRQLDGKLRELRFYLAGRPTRITYWIAPGRRIILLTVFVKTQTAGATGDRAGEGSDGTLCGRRAHGVGRGVRMARRTSWDEVKGQRPLTEEIRAAYEDEARISAFRDMVYRLRTEAGLTQAELAERMGTTQSAIARMEGGGTRPTLETLEKLAVAVGGELIVGVGEKLSENRSIAKLVRDGHAVIRRAS